MFILIRRKASIAWCKPKHIIFLVDTRIFGRNLLVDTIEELFSVSKELFEGLSITDYRGSLSSHGSIFSELNNLLNIALVDEYGGICDITQNELEENFTRRRSVNCKKAGLTS